MGTVSKPMYGWRDVPWRKLDRAVFKLQKRIYRASQRGDIKTVHRLQRLLMKSWVAKCLAVRRVTQDNQGKNTAGVDGVKSLTAKQRIDLVNNLRLNSKVKPTRRVWIPRYAREREREREREGIGFRECGYHSLLLFSSLINSCSYLLLSSLTSPSPSPSPS